ncbi:menaquinone biosynthesis protein [Marinicrinis sediminis]|uniref:Chorismate dehydratase n=1 Tax=Marinicrinis sediminis TaxID=1652465 RepID=A0ABW5RCW6_9BACL
MTTSEQPLRIGKINYTNVWPIFQHFPYEFFEDEIEVVEQVPTELNEAMARGTIDVGPISSFSFAQHADQYVLFPDLSVSAHDRVHSILLFTKKPLQQLDGCPVALPTTSATSVHLLKMILERFVGVQPTYFYAQPDLETMMNTADAALLIGDDAIRSSWKQTGYEVLDLAEQWHRYTGKWMTFAVWAVRKEAASRMPETMARIFHGFQSSKEMSTRFPEDVIAAAMREIGGTRTYWQQYFQHLCYDFQEEQFDGLQHYFALAKEMGYLQHAVSPKFWNNKSFV